MNEIKKDSARVKHPEFGYVDFTTLTIRQRDVLVDYLKLRDANNKKIKTVIHK